LDSLGSISLLLLDGNGVLLYSEIQPSAHVGKLFIKFQ
jgi:hypothetical protein